MLVGAWPRVGTSMATWLIAMNGGAAWHNTVVDRLSMYVNNYLYTYMLLFVP